MVFPDKLWSVIPTETSDDVGEKSSKISSKWGMKIRLDDALRGL